MPGRRRSEDEALAIVATMVGALTLARAVDDPELSDRILAAARTRLTVAPATRGVLARFLNGTFPEQHREITTHDPIQHT